MSSADKTSVQLIDQQLFAALLDQARQSPRRRTNHNFHSSHSENPHRFLNIMLRDSYFTPHRHLEPPKSETFIVLEGRVALLLFDDTGEIIQTHILAHDGPRRGIDIAPGLWHSLVVLSEQCICFEVKPGPYEQATDKEFAPWAPREGSPDCAGYLDRLRAIVEARN